MTADYRSVNLANWESRVGIHEQGYSLAPFRTDPTYLSHEVRFDAPRLGDIAGLDGVHLQCHIGHDTVSLSRLGARMSGLDFSPLAIDAARRLATNADAEVEFVVSDVYDAVEAFGRERFDLVYTGIGALCWIPDVRRWAHVVVGLLRPGGRLFIREGHPILWSLCDPRDDELVVIEFPYFEGDGVPFHETKTYVDHEGDLASPDIISFNHGLAEIITALMDVGMTLTAIEEHRSVPWNPLGTAMVEREDGEFELRDNPDRLAATYTLQARKTT